MTHDRVEGGAVDAKHTASLERRSAPPGRVATSGYRIACDLVLVEWLVIAGVVVLPLPALAVGARGVFRRPGYSPDLPGDRVSIIVLVTLRMLTLLLVLALSGITLLSAIGALIKGVPLHGLVYVFCVLDLLLGTLVVLTFGRRDRRRARRRVTPAAR
jgi:hypothetical protein